jgi:hypothetical protein
MARVDNISAWNAKVGNTYKYVGRQGIHYEYVMPKDYTGPWYINALTVRSKKSPTSKYNNGKKPGQYQPTGAKRYFTFYQQRMFKDDIENVWKVVLEESNRILKRVKKDG